MNITVYRNYNMALNQTPVTWSSLLLKVQVKREKGCTMEIYACHQKEHLHCENRTERKTQYLRR